ncbi:MAG: ammonium transporter [Ardenticatenaceae bacterium]|nr:ammonium transporter [Ardenticatenaceae bacterium]
MNVSNDTIWILLSAGLVFLMQAGFLALESGLTRNKNSINVAVKNIVDFTTSTLVFWLIGFGIMFGPSLAGRGWIGAINELPRNLTSNPDLAAFFIFQVMFCGTAVTILSGSVAERMKFKGYFLVSLLISALVYPFLGHWMWNGLQNGEAIGWLGQLGFVDFAGSSVVHSVGGWAALALLLILGPRAGRFPEGKPPQKISGANTPFAAFGVLILYVGWIGFNGGSVLAFNDSVLPVVANTIIAGSAGLVAPLLLMILTRDRYDTDLLMNGILAGLVAITASAHVATTFEAVMIGAIGGLILFPASHLLEKLKIDDAVGAIPVHLGAGVWGTLAVALFATGNELGTGLSFWGQFGVQLLGILVCGAWVFSTTYLVMRLVNVFDPIRVSIEQETIGLNISEHGARDPLFELVSVMDYQARTSRWDTMVEVEPFTEAGRIAEHYNKVMLALNQAVGQNQAIVSSAMDAIITFSTRDLTIFSVNPAVRDIFGYDENSLVGLPISILLQKRETGSEEPLADLLADLAANGRLDELVGRRIDGSHFPLEISLTFAQNQIANTYIAVLRDISERQRTQAELEEANQELMVARDEALVASRLKGELLGRMGHELRTPLGAILGYAELLQSGVYGEMENGQQEITEEIIDSTRYLTEIINQVLDQAKIESGKLTFARQDVSLHELIGEIRSLMKPQAQQKGIQLNFEIDPILPSTVQGDKNRLKQILVNLVGNAIKFTEQGTVSVSLNAYDASFWEMEIKDTGIGISEEMRDFIFEPFRQVDGGATRLAGGTGLGLSITKQLVELIGGKISVRANGETGSIFSVLLPFQMAVETPSSQTKFNEQTQ